jgi:hypothetical protein
MKALVGLRRRWVVALVVAGLATAGGVAYATIPDSGGVYTACVLNKVGTIRLIDPSLGSSSLLAHCTALETQITWNQRGADGVSPTVAQLSTGDSHCPVGGAAITDAHGTTAFVCSGKDGQPFAGTFTSPNGKFSLTVADAGVQIVGPDSKISLPGSGGVAVKSDGDVSIAVGGNASTTVAGSRTETVGGNESITIGGGRTESVGAAQTLVVGGARSETVGGNEAVTIHGSRTEKIDQNENVTISGNRSERVDGDETIQVGADRTETIGNAESLVVGGAHTETAGGALSLAGSHVSINGGTTCAPAARVGDLVTSALTILTGSPTVCIG